MEAVVVDAGSKILKAGFAAPDQDPALIIPTKMKRMVEDGEPADSSAVEEVMVDPVVRGFIRDWDAMEDLLRHVLYTNLGWEVGEEGQILFTDPLSTPKAVREQLVQLMFETFNVSGFYASEQAVLSLYAVGRISGCTVDIGHGKIDLLMEELIIYINKFYNMLDIAPVCEGAVQHIASKRFEIGGIDLTNLLAQELHKSNPSVNIDISEVEKLKEQYACCAEDQTAFEEIQNSCQKEQHTLPDGQDPAQPNKVTLIRQLLLLSSELLGLGSGGHLMWGIFYRSRFMLKRARLSCTLQLDMGMGMALGMIAQEGERYIVGEALFQPSILCLEEYGIVEQLVRSISSVSSENHRQLLENIVLCGGTASMLGFEERFQREANLCSSSVRPSLVKPPEYMPENLSKNSAWMGGFEERFQREANLCSSSVRPSLVKPPEYMPENLSKNSAWMGGAILAKVVFPQNQHVTKADYDETGPSIVHKKCF
ncbi:actin-related protein 7 [Cocos nucifera]|uniref:Actin-related protein 7 n=1 Tax=Cocos nucifera TaxID=13894 RepID=A0A8K0IDQ0_COCNU|nr:actin-related protein 7 [Cocos nucifera]